MDDHAVRLVYFRILLGIVKMTVAAPVFLSLYEAGAVALNAAAATSRDTSCWTVIGRFVELFYSYPVYLYFNFAGYCDIVIAGASLVGVDLPENFDRPYLARNVIDFWTRWHRTLGFWIRDYLFLPLYKGVVENWPEKADSLAFLCYFVAFLVAGIWHGATTNFVIYGLIQAVGVSAAKLWENHLLKSGGRSGLKKYMQSSRMRAVAIVGTLHFECFSLLFFPCDLATTGRMLRTLWSAVI